nr:protein sda1 [Hymenolepis microstoma]
MGVTLTELNLSELESQIRRDSESYLSDFQAQYENYVALEATYLSAPSEYVPKLESLLRFFSQIIHLYPAYAKTFSENVKSALLSRFFGMNAHMRMAYLKAFMLLRTRNFINLQESVEVAFRLHRCHDKRVRKTLRGFVISDMKRTNSKNNNGKANTEIRNLLVNAVKDNDTTVAKEAVILLVELYRRNVWRNEKCVNMISNACLAKSKKVYSKAVRFFLGHDEKSIQEDSDSDSDENVGVDTRIKQLKLAHRVGAKTNKRKKRMDRNVDNLMRKSKRKAKEHLPQGINLYAITLINDPQTFAEKLFHKLEKCNDRLEMRMLLIELISHLIGVHQLLLLNFYPSLQRFLRPQQREITHLLLFAAQASHDQVPPDVMVPLVRTITDNFVTDRASAEAITVGLNTIREICARCPYAVDEDLLSDLISYKSYRNKNVVAAARSLIRLYRQINPALLPKREIGRPTVAIKEALGLEGVDITDVDALAAADMPARQFGKRNVATGIAGAEVLVEKVSGKKRKLDSRQQNDRDCDCHHEHNEEEDDEQEIKPPKKRRKLESETSREEESGNDDEEGSEESDSAEESEDDEGQKECLSDVSKSVEEKGASSAKNKSAKNLTPEEILATRILTDEDFEAIRKRQAEKKTLFAAAGGRNKKRGTQLVIDEEDLAGTNIDGGEDSYSDADPEEASGLVSMRNITKLVKRAHSTKADRMESIEEGREGRKKYGFQVNRMNPHASTTNREKRKNKTFQMIKHKARRKVKRSFREKQAALREHLKKFSKNFRH